MERKFNKLILLFFPEKELKKKDKKETEMGRKEKEVFSPDKKSK